MIVDWPIFVLNAVGGAIALVSLCDGTRRICAHGMDRRAGLMVGSAVAFYAVFGFFAFWNYLELTDTLNMRRHAAASAPTARDPAKGLSPEKRESENVDRARHAFWASGTFETYLDRLNEKKLFQPSQSDIKRRELLVINQAQLEYAARSSFTEALLWLVTGLLGVLFGYAFSREKNPVAPGAAVAGSEAETSP